MKSKFLLSLIVTVGTIDGQTLDGQMVRFRPEDPYLILEPISGDGTTSRDVGHQRIPVERISYIAFHQGAGRAQLPNLTQPQDLKLYLAGGAMFNVRVDQPDLANPLGFFAYPLGDEPLHRQYYFYAANINARESTELLGEMLLADGAVDSQALDQGVLNQRSERRIPIGQILIQQKNVAPDDVADAQRQQARRNLRIGQVLVEMGLITEEDVSRALSEQKKRRDKRLGEVLVDLGIIKETALFKTLARKFQLAFVDLDEVEIDGELINRYSETVLRKHHCLPLGQDNDILTVAIGDPLNFKVLDSLRFQYNIKMREVLVAPSQLRRYIDKHLSEAEQSGSSRSGLNEILKILEAESGTIESVREQISDTEISESDNTVIRLANKIIVDAYRRGASDIHIEPNGPQNKLIVRIRVDGDCTIYEAIPPAFRNNLVARLKILAGLDISERRKPQDGKIKLKVDGKDVELRVSTMPTVNANEDVVMRILASSKSMPLSQMGFNDRNFKAFEEIIAKPYGLVLVVGPTGSGKTTTLHSALNHINQVNTKIWTAEDPVEITQSGLRQVQMNPKVGLNFATAMRGFLRLDPDVIMIGEMRDHETASTAVEASLTGHLVLSTLHTNSAPETVTRLLDMGLEPFTFADALIGVMAQRLSRSLCKFCRLQYEASNEEYDLVAEAYGEEQLRRNLGVGQPSDLRLWKGSGCNSCNNTGYKGRIALHELLVNNEDLSQTIQHHRSAAEIRKLAIDNGMITLFQDGIEKSFDGKTDLRQVMAVCNR
ncbi:MAG: ATPase, T2SS/T4P/T4SS family [Desulfobacterales bacterium]